MGQSSFHFYFSSYPSPSLIYFLFHPLSSSVAFIALLLPLFPWPFLFTSISSTIIVDLHFFRGRNVCQTFIWHRRPCVRLLLNLKILDLYGLYSRRWFSCRLVANKPLMNLLIHHQAATMLLQVNAAIRNFTSPMRLAWNVNKLSSHMMWTIRGKRSNVLIYGCRY
jgi:hypothetical protein